MVRYGQYLAMIAQALPALHWAFGWWYRVNISLIFYEGECSQGYHVSILLPPSFSRDPEECLRAFDREWWIAHCEESDGCIVFDYEVMV